MIKPMLCQEIKEIREGNYYYQEKKDGERVILDRGRIFNRRGEEITEKFPEIKAPKNLVLDGELCCVDGVFNHIQSRVYLENPFKIGLMSRKYPAIVWAFDILFEGDKDLRDLPLCIRKKSLKEFEGIRLLSFFDEYEKLLDYVKGYSLEGIVLKPKESRYIENDRTTWLKFKMWKEKIVEFNGFETNPDDSITLINKDGIRVKAPNMVRYEMFPIKCEIQYLEITDNNKLRMPTMKRVI